MRGRQKPSAGSTKEGTVVCNLWSVASVAVAVILAACVLRLASTSIFGPKLWSVEELGKYNGEYEALPILLSVLGSVFDVSSGKTHYGPGGGYNHFAGRDASRSFSSGNFTGEGLTDSLKGLSALQVKTVDDWRVFFQKKYRSVGKLVGTYYDLNGNPTVELIRVAKKVALGVQLLQQQKADETRFPACNSRWDPHNGGEVWCSVGYPRIVSKVEEGPLKGPARTRCACFESKYLNRKGLQLYEGCESFSQRCRSS